MKCPNCFNPLTEKPDGILVCLTCNSEFTECFTTDYWAGVINEKNNKALNQTSWLIPALALVKPG